MAGLGGISFTLKRIATFAELATLLQATVVELNREEVLGGSYDQYTFFLLIMASPRNRAGCCVNSTGTSQEVEVTVTGPRA